MLSIWGEPFRSDCERVTRRNFLKVGALGLTGLSLPGLLSARADTAARGRELSEYLNAARRAGAWLAAQQPLERESLPGGVGAWSKAPWALAVTGEAEAANRVLDTLRDRLMPHPGEFYEAGTPEAANSWRVYSNACILLGAARLGRWDVASPAAADRLCAYQHSSGGFLGNIDDAPVRMIDPCQSAQAGWTCLALGRHEAARRVADFLVRLLELQPDPTRFLYFEFDTATGKLVTDLPPGESINYRLDLERSRQPFFHAGISMGYLADLYLWTGEQRYLDAAEGYFDFDLHTNPDGYTWPSKGKVGWGAALLYRATGEAQHRQVAERVADISFLRAQQADGSWLSFVFPTRDDYSGIPIPVTALTAEFAYELMEIVRGLSRS